METVSSTSRNYRRLSIVESVFAYTGKILAARPWETAGFTEIDLHLPGTDMRQWTETMHLKCKVASLTYRDYSPAFWDAETSTCTLLVDTLHEGPGAAWARNVEPGDPLYFLKIGSSHQAMSPAGRNVLLGDASAAGHFAGMLQAAGTGYHTAGAIEWSSRDHGREFLEYFPVLPLDAVTARETPGVALEHWIRDFVTDPDDHFFLAGGVKMVSRLRSFLKETGVSGRHINAQAFWR